jgi:hypothetical protein
VTKIVVKTLPPIGGRMPIAQPPTKAPRATQVPLMTLKYARHVCRLAGLTAS